MSEHQTTMSASRVETPTSSGAMLERPAASLSSQGQPTGRRRNDRIISASAEMQTVVDLASGVARSHDPVLLSGPSGCGRKHLARAIHQWSPLAASALIEFSATGQNESTQQRELFGDGGANGAVGRATGGTLLVDGVDQLAHGVQTRLAELVREPVGQSGRPRVLATATVTAGDGAGLAAFDGSDAAHRIEIAPLCERTEDILPLAAHFLAEFAAQEGVDAVGFSADARRWLIEEPWTGNVRELRERIRQAIRLAGQGAISAEALMLSTEGDEVPSFKDAKRAFETRYVEGLLRRCGGNISRAARMAKKDRKDFYDVIRRTGVDPGHFRG
jgi:two-component system response regulator GlrR